jgi:PD-(D/E)XK nuclease superfamily protein
MKKVYLWETKTSSEDLAPGSTFWKRTILDPQLSLYVPALKALGYDPHGCIYDALRKPAHRPSSKGETPEKYGARCLDAIGEAPDKYYARGVVVRLEEESKEAAADNWNTASQMRDAKRLNIFPRNPDSCIDWGRECDYLNVCARMASIDDPVLFQHESAHVELDKGEGNLSDDLSLLTQSSMRTYRKCPRKFQFRYILRTRPLKKAATLATGTSVHDALEVYRKTGGDLDAAKKALKTEDLFVRAKEAAMVTGYAARWGAPTGIIEVEHQFRIKLINPETGAASKTFTLGGKVDAIVAVESVGELMNPAPPVSADTLEKQLEMSLDQ